MIAVVLRLVGNKAYFLLSFIFKPPRKEPRIMIAYGCLGILFLFIIIKIAVYFNRQKHAPTHEDLDETLLAIANRRRDDAS